MMKKQTPCRIGAFSLVLAWSFSASAQEAEPETPAAEPAEEVAQAEEDPPEAEPAPEAAEPAEPVADPEPEPEEPEEPAETEPEPPAPAAPEPAEEAPPAAVEDAPADKYIDPQFNIGTGLRVGYTYDFDVPDENFAHMMGTNIRPYMNGQISKDIKFEANLDSAFTSTGDATVRLLDAVIKIEPHQLVNFWVGRFLPPSDRANLSGPYFQNSWNYPVQANLFPAIYAGRHDGFAYWGQVGEGMFKWQLGMFDATGGDQPLLAGRLVLNLLDPEGGYYNASTYYGAKDVLAIGATLQYQDGGDVTLGSQIDGAAFEADLLFEKNLGVGTLSVEGAYYNFNSTDLGQSFMANLSYLLPGKQGWGTLQPQARMQMMFPDQGDSYATFDGALNYIIDGHNARFTLTYQHIGGHDGIDADNLLTLGGQIQIF